MQIASKPKIGLTMGKFMPPHKGHELMIDFAYQNCDHLTVLVTVHAEDPYNRNLEWLQQLAALRGWERIKFIPQTDPFLGKSEADADGTITDEAYWEWWLADTRSRIGPRVDAVFTSDKYGERIAREFGGVWYPVDPNREMIDISATRIRANPIKHYLDIIEPARPAFCKTIAIIGAEATGKTTMTKRLGKAFGSEIALEYGRTICETRPDLTAQDFQIIINGQKSLIESAKRRSQNGFVFTDTEEYTTYLFMQHYESTKENSTLISPTSIFPIADYYILLGINRPTIDDGSRFLTEKERLRFQEGFINFLWNHQNTIQDSYLTEEKDYEKRFDEVYRVVKEWTE